MAVTVNKRPTQELRPSRPLAAALTNRDGSPHVDARTSSLPAADVALTKLLSLVE